MPASHPFPSASVKAEKSAENTSSVAGDMSLSARSEHAESLYSTPAGFIDEAAITLTLQETRNPDSARVRAALDTARELKGLSVVDVAVLLQNTNPTLDEAIFECAKGVKEAIYGNRLVLFAPLYVTSECCNNCLYCGFSRDNNDIVRETLSDEALSREVNALTAQGQKRLLMVYGEHPRLGADWVAHTMQTAYDAGGLDSSVRRINVNCAPFDVDGFRKLHDVGIGTYQCFMETYHRPTYEHMHPSGPKSDYNWRLYALHRAMEAGIDDVATGVLFGLSDPLFEVLALLAHARELERAYGVGPHTISFPRLEPADGSDLSLNPPHPVPDHLFKKIVAVLRLAVPYTGLILSTRETPAFRDELIEVGVSQLSAASCTAPGGYSQAEQVAGNDAVQDCGNGCLTGDVQCEDCDSAGRPDAKSSCSGKGAAKQSGQFTVGDCRTLDEVVRSVVLDHDAIPSWCTACYRTGRTGEHFMELAKTGFIQRFCHPNAILTFKEYLLDHASASLREAGDALIARELSKMPEARRETIVLLLRKMEKGQRDLYL